MIKATLLIVDENKAILSSLEQIMKSEFEKVISLTNPNRIVEILRNNAVDIVMLDTNFRSVYLRSLERTWEVKRMEHIPWFNFAYGAITGNDCELEQSVKHLREWTLDCTVHNYQNSHRDDLYLERGYTSYEGGKRAISPRESTVMTGSRNATVLDDGAGGNIVKEPTGFLRDYWMGRYHGFIKGPETDDPELISVNPSKSSNIGAKPYDGPARPVF